ncbi:MAG: hypothetical protein IKT41_00575, partial [Clostridia bacterium]|nr:hypothetical protein [Clostridia bacterium]
MRNLKKISMVVISILAILLIAGGVVNAATLTLKVTAEKEVTVGGEITVTVDWTEGMQAADFILNYDKDKVEYVSSSIAEDYLTNDASNGKVKVVWISLNDKDMTKITFTFKAKANGEAKFSTEIDGGFANGEMVSPDSYDVKTYGTTAVTLKASLIHLAPALSSKEILALLKISADLNHPKMLS